MKKLHILLVEDNQGDVFVTREALNETNAIRKISIVNDGDEAMHFLEDLYKKNDSDYPDLIFMEAYLRKINGYEVLKYIKTSNYLMHIPVIISTDSNYENDINNAYKNLANAYVAKPSEIDVFISQISKTIEYWTTIATLPTLTQITD